MEHQTEYDKIITDLECFAERVQDAYETGMITEDNGRDLAEMYRIIMNQITLKLNADMKERLVNTMGGKVLELSSDRWFNEGRQAGEADGIQKGIQKGTDDAVLKLAYHYCSENSDLSREEAIRMAEKILR